MTIIRSYADFKLTVKSNDIKHLLWFDRLVISNITLQLVIESLTFLITIKWFQHEND